MMFLKSPLRKRAFLLSVFVETRTFIGYIEVVECRILNSFMPTIPKNKLETLLHNAHSKRIAVIGDVMIDKYIWGTVSRVSPEAPVPVVEVEQESLRLGGAANVGNNIASLGPVMTETAKNCVRF
jgi:hypothetical protein